MSDKELETEVPEGNAPVVTPEEGIEDLKRKLQAEQAARAEAERRAQEAQAQAQRATSDVEDTNLALLKTAIDHTKRDRETLKQEYAQAMAHGNYDAAANIQQEMSDTAARLLQMESGREAMEQRARQPKPVPQRDPVEALAAQLSQRSAAWVRAHPQYATNNARLQEMLGAHNVVTARGVVPDTDEYFAQVENILGLSSASADAPLSAASAPTQQRSAPPAVPVGRGNGTRSNVVRLTAEEREIASMMGMKEEEYAKNKMELKAAGRLN